MRLERHLYSLWELNGTPGDLVALLVRETLPPETARALTELREALQRHYSWLSAEAKGLDATLERTVISARNAAVAGAQEIERKLVASLKLEHDTLVRQDAPGRAAV